MVKKSVSRITRPRFFVQMQKFKVFPFVGKK